MRPTLFIRMPFISFNQDAKLKLVYKAANGDEYWLTLISLNLSTKFQRERKSRLDRRRNEINLFRDQLRNTTMRADFKLNLKDEENILKQVFFISKQEK